MLASYCKNKHTRDIYKNYTHSTLIYLTLNTFTESRCTLTLFSSVFENQQHWHPVNGIMFCVESVKVSYTGSLLLSSIMYLTSEKYGALMRLQNKIGEIRQLKLIS